MLWRKIRTPNNNFWRRTLAFAWGSLVSSLPRYSPNLLYFMCLAVFCDFVLLFVRVHQDRLLRMDSQAVLTSRKILEKIFSPPLCALFKQNFLTLVTSCWIFLCALSSAMFQNSHHFRPNSVCPLFSAIFVSLWLKFFSLHRAFFHFSSPFAPFPPVKISVITLRLWLRLCHAVSLW